VSLKLYTGIMGSGKTYEVVSEVILNSLRQGRRVVSNIAGLDIKEFTIILQSEGVPLEAIGELVLVTHAQVLNPQFWLTDTDDLSSRISGFIASVTGEKIPCIRAGDVVCLDEIWRFWNGFSTKDEDGKKRPDRVMNFFRMHRQMPDPESGLTCEIVLITQDPQDASRQVRGVVETIYCMTKLTALGMDKLYRVDIYARKITRSPLRSIQRSYNPKYFPLYASHSQKKEGGADAVEQSVDKRGNLFANPIYKYGIPLALLPIIPAFIFLWRMFHPAPPVEETSAPVSIAGAPAQNSTVNNQPEVNLTWRVVGVYNSGAVLTFIIQSNTGEVRQLIDPPNFQQLGFGYSVELPEGGFATSWTRFNQTDKGLI